MRLSHHSPTSSLRTGNRRPGDRGYVLVMFAMLLVPMLLMVGLSVDVGSWYHRVSDIRKAADAAALAGVVWLPDVGEAKGAAEAAATRNGFTNGVDDIVVEVYPSLQNDRRLSVKITDKKVGSFLWGNLGGRDIRLSRTSHAEYVLPVPLGSPRNFFGTGPLVASPNTELLFQSINPYCTSKVQGDRHQSGYFSAGAAHCSGTSNTSGAHAEYKPDGYELYIDAPTGGPGPIEVLLYDPRYNEISVDPAAPDEQVVGETWETGVYTHVNQCPNPSSGSVSLHSSGYCQYSRNQTFRGPITWYNQSRTRWENINNNNWTGSTQYVLPRYKVDIKNGPDSYLSGTEANQNEDYTFELYAENSPFTSSDDVLVCSKTYSRDAAFELTYLGSKRWNRLCTVPGGVGRYILKARNQGAPSGSANSRGNGSNQWGLVARYTGGWAGNLGNGLCDGRTQAICPRVYGKDAISVYANTDASTAQFFLAEIEEIHAGKRLIIDLWDPGEGGSSLRILQPNGTAWSRKNMAWRSYNYDGTVHDSGETGVQTIDVTSSYFNGKRLEVTIDLEGYAPALNNQWWKIEYEFNDPGRENVTDRTTWSARIEGDPVHLVEEY